MQHEYEIKFRKIDKEAFVKKLSLLGFLCQKKEFLSQRKTFHFLQTEKNEWFRVRSEQWKVTMTYKCIHEDSIKGVEEIEIQVNSFEWASEILQKTGLINTAFQENTREIWVHGDIEVCIDTWPWLNPYIEIEWPTERSVREIVSELWLEWDEGIFWGSEVIYEKELGIPREVFIKIPVISFQNPPKIWNSEM